MKSPYENLPADRFWRTAVSETPPPATQGLYVKRFSIAADDRIVTAGSCFAQHIAGEMRRHKFTVLDYEPAPDGLAADVARQYGYGIYSARYGNIYAVRQLLQLVEDCLSGHVDPADFWIKDGRFFDSLRPGIEPNGFETLDEAVEHRKWHLENVRRLFDDMTVLVFTFGLTEAWVNRSTGRVYPTAPGTIAGEYDPAIHVFRNFSSREIFDDFVHVHDMLKARNPALKILLTVSPVPLTATASENHVLVANTYSKSVLRAVAGELTRAYPDIDYFPSYEIVATPWSRGSYYESNLRSVSPDGVKVVMETFFRAHGSLSPEAARELTPEARGSQAKAEAAPVNREAARAARRAARLESDPVFAKRHEERQARRRTRDELKKAQNGPADPAKAAKTDDDVVCEEILLDAFSR